MCGDSQCSSCKIVTGKIYKTQQALAELREKMESSDYSIQDLPADAQLGFKMVAALVEDITSLAILGPELNGIGRTLRLHLDAFSGEIKCMEGLAP
jgi:hypothetical protein